MIRLPCAARRTPPPRGFIRADAIPLQELRKLHVIVPGGTQHDRVEPGPIHRRVVPCCSPTDDTLPEAGLCGKCIIFRDGRAAGPCCESDLPLMHHAKATWCDDDAALCSATQLMRAGPRNPSRKRRCRLGRHFKSVEAGAVTQRQSELPGTLRLRERLTVCDPHGEMWSLREESSIVDMSLESRLHSHFAQPPLGA